MDVPRTPRARHPAREPSRFRALTGDFKNPMQILRSRPLLVPVGLALAVITGCLLLYRFANFREERAVRQFLDKLRVGDYQQAYQAWGPSSTYSYADFTSDWGERGYYGKVTSYKILDSQTTGSGVIVYVEFDHLKKPLAFWVDRKTRTLGFAPDSR